MSSVSKTRRLYCGELARQCGVSADTVRFYERRKLLPPAERTSAGYRIFPPECLAQMHTIRAGLSMGFSVAELADIFRERNAGRAPCHRVRKLAAEKLALLDAKMHDLQNWRRELRSTLKAWDRRLSKTPRGKQARLLETLAQPKSRTRFPSRGTRKWETP